MISKSLPPTLTYANIVLIVLFALEMRSRPRRPFWFFLATWFRAANQNGVFALWRISFPRMSYLSGFELDSGIYITTTYPEEVAQFL
jgi:hypothetical protein